MGSERPDLPWRFGVIDSADVNALAAPGGYPPHLVVLGDALVEHLVRAHRLAPHRVEDLLLEPSMQLIPRPRGGRDKSGL